MPFRPGRIGRSLKAVVLCATALCGSISLVLARTDHAGPLRSQTNEILVPVLVLNKSRAFQFHHMQPVAWRQQVIASGYKMWESLADANLHEADFKLYEDGEEQRIQSVMPESEDSDQYIASNFGRYWQAIGVAGGTWSIPDWLPEGDGVTPRFANGEHIYREIPDASPEWHHVSGSNLPPVLVNLPPLPWYMISYSPPPAAPGSCHRITVKVDRADTLIYSRSEYCDASDSAADALADAKLGARLKTDLLSKKKNALAVRITAIPVFTPTGASRTRLFVDANLDPVSIDCNSFMDGSGIVGLIYSKDGTLAGRFSDGLFYAPGENSLYWDTEWFTPANWPGRVACSDVFYEPTRYQTQLNLSPGTYQLKVGFWNGHKFGRAALPLTVEHHDPRELAIGGLALVRRYRDAGPNRKVLPRSLADRYPPLIAGGIEIAPASDTRFKRGAPLHFYLQVYEPQKTGAQQPAVLVHLQIVDGKTGRILKQPRPTSAAPFVTPGDPVIPITAAIDISNLAKGSYELQAQATDSTGATTPWRSAHFTIEK